MVFEKPVSPILQPFRVAAVADAVLAFEMCLPIVCLDFVEHLRRMSVSRVLGEDLLFFGRRKTGFGFERKEQFDRPQIRLELSHLPDRRQNFVAYLVVSLSLRYVLGRVGSSARYWPSSWRSFARLVGSTKRLASCGSATT